VNAGSKRGVVGDVASRVIQLPFRTAENMIPIVRNDIDFKFLEINFFTH
jgi:hypothetical protein